MLSLSPLLRKTLFPNADFEFDHHEEVFEMMHPKLGAAGYIAIHRKRYPAPSLGATRMWRYATDREALEDALRLSRLMTYKAAFAGLPYGGAKAIIMLPEHAFGSRRDLFSWYGEAINALGGQFVTGSDVGVGDEDVRVMREKSAFVIGAGVSAGYYTALGVLEAIRAALEELHGNADIRERTFAIQGLGKTGTELVRLLHDEGARIVVADVDDAKVREVMARFPRVAGTHFEAIHAQPVDVFSPCALHHSINTRTVSQLQCKAIAGAANNQMESEAVEASVHNRGILYAVDFVANSGGLLSVVDGYEHGSMHDDGRIRNAIASIRTKLRDVFLKSRSQESSPGVVARGIAETKVISDHGRS